MRRGQTDREGQCVRKQGVRECLLCTTGGQCPSLYSERKSAVLSHANATIHKRSVSQWLPQKHTWPALKTSLSLWTCHCYSVTQHRLIEQFKLYLYVSLRGAEAAACSSALHKHNLELPGMKYYVIFTLSFKIHTTSEAPSSS